ADCKYHEFFNAEGKVLVADIGHFESEQFTKEIFKAYLSEKIPNFVTYYSEVNTNPINHL
ncbi:MAG: Nif3-like dinuclear metal center hexameric protein, partial [Paludibacteraceae bacterium]|nr:Nif3-like dinuclear metal center hexameric protein [Paludibacteraceae bacterium]